MDDIWKEVLHEIELEVSKGTYLTFFKDTSLISFENSVATIGAPTPITAEFIEKRYYALIKNTLDKKTTQDVSLVFTSRGKTFTTPQPSSSIGPLFVEQQKRETPINSRLRRDYTFDTFAESESNRLAYTACATIAAHPGNKYNPLYLYGTVGVGKTHLMHAVAHAMYASNPHAHVLYLTTEEFTNEVVEAIRDKTTTQLRKKFRNVSLLLLDDVQFLTGKERVQEELFHTFNTLVDKGSQVIFASDRPPSEIKKIEARLASRFEGGLTVDIEPPDFELRTAILLKKAEKLHLAFTVDSAKLAAERITDARALEGFLLRLMSEISTKPSPITPALIGKLLGDKMREDANIIRPDDIINAICSYYNIKQTQLKGTKRDASLVTARHVCMFLLKEEVGLPFVEIGNLLGGRDHTTVMHGVGKIRKLFETNTKTHEEIAYIKRQLQEEYLS